LAAALNARLVQHAIIGLDTNPFIYLFERHPQFFPLAQSLFDYLKTPGVQGFTSVITLIETCVQPQREGRADLVKIYEQALSNSVQVQMLPIDAVLAKRAIVLRVQYGFRVPDALQLALALEANATLFVTMTVACKNALNWSFNSSGFFVTCPSLPKLSLLNPQFFIKTWGLIYLLFYLLIISPGGSTDTQTAAERPVCTTIPQNPGCFGPLPVSVDPFPPPGPAR
jgi:predicted nucleic acid-binding protein